MLSRAIPLESVTGTRIGYTNATLGSGCPVVHRALKMLGKGKKRGCVLSVGFWKEAVGGMQGRHAVGRHGACSTLQGQQVLT